MWASYWAESRPARRQDDGTSNWAAINAFTCVCCRRASRTCDPCRRCCRSLACTTCRSTAWKCRRNGSSRSHNEPLRQVTVLLDPGLQMVTAQCGDSPASWSVAPAADGQATRVVLSLPEPIQDTERVLRLGALAPLVLDRPWRLPRMRAEGLSWQEGELTLLIPEPLTGQSALADRLCAKRHGAPGVAPGR